MPLYAKKPQETNLEPIQPDTYQAVCYAVVDIGTHHNEVFDTKQRKIVLIWELPELDIDFEKDGQKQTVKRSISKQYTLSLSEKANLYKDLLSWRGVPFTPEELEGFDVRKVAGINCLLSIVNEPSKDGKKIYSKIASISKLMKTMPSVKPEHEIVTYSIQDDGIDNIPQNLPEWLVKEIKKSLEYQGIMDARQSGGFDEQAADNYDPNNPDDIPF